jgi:cell division septation protein DedD
VSSLNGRFGFWILGLVVIIIIVVGTVDANRGRTVRAQAETRAQAQAEARTRAQAEARANAKASEETRRVLAFVSALSAQEVSGNWEVRLIAYRDEKRADELTSILNGNGIPAFSKLLSVHGELVRQTYAGPFPTKDAADAALSHLKILVVMHHSKAAFKAMGEGSSIATTPLPR